MEGAVISGFLFVSSWGGTPEAPYFVIFEPTASGVHPPCKTGHSYCFALALTADQLLEFPNGQLWLKASWASAAPRRIFCTLPSEIHARYASSDSARRD